MNKAQSTKYVEYLFRNDKRRIKRMGANYLVTFTHKLTQITYDALILEDGSIDNSLEM